MPETIHVRGEGGAIFAMDLPLPEPIQERLSKGLLQRVNDDGTPYTGSPAAQVMAPESDGEQDGGEKASPAAADRPAVNAPKADWITYVVSKGLLSREDAEAFTKADLIEMTS